MNHEKVVTRFAPSPTGFMHVGGIRTALFAYLLAKKHNGTFILRIEDTDKKREVEGAVKQIMDSLTWLGITWDFGPDKPSPVFGSLIQSERLPIYHRYARTLIEKGFAYVDNTSEEGLEKLRTKAEEEKRPFLFREIRPETLDTSWEVGKVLRFKVTDIKRTDWHDAVRGNLSAGEEALDDFILIKEDGFPTYNFCHIVDDIEMNVTHIMRGEEFIASVPKFISLYNALGVTPPVFVTLPPVLGESGNKKLSKRDGAKSALDYKNEGYTSDALFNFLAFLGFNPGGEQEIYTREQLAEVFDVSKIQKSGARFNPEKLDWYNKEYLKNLPEEELKEKSLSYFSEEREDVRTAVSNFFTVAKERMTTLRSYYDDFKAGEYDYLVEDPTYDAVSLVWKKGTKESTLENLEKLLILSKEKGGDELTRTITTLAEEIGKGDVFWPLRVALSGKEKSPDPLVILKAVGNETLQRRLQNAINYLRTS